MDQSSKGTRIAGYILSGLPILFLLMDGIMKIVKPAFVVTETVRLGFPETVIVPLGIVLIICTLLYLLPTSAVLGAILLTGYLGGAVATHVRMFEGAFPIVLPVVLGVMIWGGLYLRDARIRALLPLIETRRAE
ncbi:MAG TPA: DoxX family protein [Pyrinomonadaceae bacterium]